MKRNHAAAGRLESGNAISDEATEAFITARIESAQAALWQAELTRRLLTLVIASLVVGLGWTVLDQWIHSPGTMGRILMASSLVLAAIAYVWWRLWPIMHLRISEEYAARALERDHAELGHSLSSYVSLRRQHDAHPEGPLARRVIHSVGVSAAGKLRQIDAPPRESTGLAAWWAGTIALIAACAIYALASPKNSFQSIARLVAPAASLDAPKRVRITDVSPGDVEALAGGSIEIAATVENLRADEPVFFRWESSESPNGATAPSAPETSISDRDQIRLLPRDSSTGRNRFFASVPLSHHAQGRRRYRILAGDENVGPYQVSIRDTPVVQIREVAYEPPAYTGKPRHTRQSGAVRGIDGTSVRLFATVNRPIVRALIEFNPRKVGRDIQATAGTREMQVAADGRSIEFSFPLRHRDGAATSLQNYRLRAWDDAGQSNADPIVYPIEIIEDLPPEINIVIPQESIVDVPINGRQDFEIHAADVDFGLAEIEIEIRRGIDLIARSSLWKDPAGKRGNQVVEYHFRPSRIIVAGDVGTRRGSGLNVGDEIEVVAIATDNRFDPEDNSITPGVSKTQPVRMRITAAAQSSVNEEEQGEGDQEKGETGEGAQGEGEQGEGEKGEGAQGEGAQGEGAQGEGEQGEGAQGEGEQGEGEKGEGDGEQSGEGEASDGGGGRQAGMGDDASGNDSGGAESAEQAPSGNADGDPSGDTNSHAGESEGAGETGGSSAKQPAQPPQDDAEAFERIQEYLQQNENAQRSPEDDQSGGKANETPNPSKSGESHGDAGNGSKSGQGSDQQGKPKPTGDGEADDSETNRSPGGQSPDADRENVDAEAEPSDTGKDGSGSDAAAERQERENSAGRGKSGSDPTGADNSEGGQRSQNEETDDGSVEDRERGAGGEADGAEAGQPMNENNPRSGGDGQAGEAGGDEGSRTSDEAGEGNAAENASDPTDGQGRGMSNNADGVEGSNSADNANQSDQTADGNPSLAGDSSTADGSPAGSGQQDKNSSGASQESDSAPRDQNQNGAPGNNQDGGSKSEAMAAEPGDIDGADEQPGSSGQAGQSDRAGDAPTALDAKGKETSQGGGGGQSAEGEGTGESIDDEAPDPVDLEYTKAATDMVLDYLDETRADPDSNLLQRLQWTQQDLQRFRERWQNVKPIDDRPISGTTPDEIEEALRSLGMRPTVTTGSTRRDAADPLRSLRDAGNRRPAPAEIRDAFEAFRRGL